MTWEITSFNTPIEPGTQIIYIPDHANGDENHPDCEEGFVTSRRGNIAFCRYWSKHDPNSLRTTDNIEATPIDNVIVKATRDQSVIEWTMTLINSRR